MAISLGSGLGAFAAIAAQPAYGATFITPTRVLTFKTAKITFDPHQNQGRPYLRGGQLFNVGSAREILWQNAKVTLTGDVVNTGHALLLASALGTTSTLTELGTTTAYGLGGIAGAVVGAPEISGTFMDMQIGIPTADGTQHPFNFHSCYVTKAEWVLDRTGLVTYSYDLDVQYVESTTVLITPTFPAAPVPFNMATGLMEFGAYGAEALVDGIRKVTVSLDRKVTTDRIYNGNTYQDVPVSSNEVDLKVSLEADYTVGAKPALFDLLLAGTPTSMIVGAVGKPIGVSSYNDTFKLNASNIFVDTGGEPNVDGPEIVKNTLQASGTVDAAGNAALTAWLYTADATY